MKTLLFTLLLATFLLAGCDSASNSDQPEGLSISMAIDETVRAGTIDSQADELVISGTNGILTITDIALIVAEFELAREDDICDDELTDDSCEEFELAAYFVDLPLAEGAVTIGTEDIPAGLYEELEFEIENLELDEDDNTVDTSLFQSILATFPDWPGKASMRVEGTFTPTGGTPQPFVVYFDAEIEIEMEFNPPLEITAEDPGQMITISINPENWFKRNGIDVDDLSAMDYGQTQDLVEFEVEMEGGFTRVEFDDDENEDEEDDDDDDEEEDDSGDDSEG